MSFSPGHKKHQLRLSDYNKINVFAHNNNNKPSINVTMKNQWIPTTQKTRMAVGFNALSDATTVWQ